MTTASVRDRLRFDAASHTYWLDGKRLPSVTEILRPLMDFSFLESSPSGAATLEAARELGRAVHEAVHYEVSGGVDESSLDPLVVPYVRAWRSFVDWCGWAPQTSEGYVVSLARGYAGTLDQIGFANRLQWSTVDAKGLCLVDLKTGAEHPSHELQTAAYSDAWQEMYSGRIANRFSLYLRPNGTFRMKVHDHRRRDWHTAVFLSRLNCWKWSVEHGLADR